MDGSYSEGVELPPVGKNLVESSFPYSRSPSIRQTLAGFQVHSQLIRMVWPMIGSATQYFGPIQGMEKLLPVKKPLMDGRRIILER